MPIRPPRRMLPLSTSRWIPEQGPYVVKRGSTNYQSPAPDHLTIIRVLILVTVFGWIFFGVMSIMCINGRGQAGRWIPEWSLDSKGSRWHKIGIVTWWLAVIILWPVILPVLVIKNGIKEMVRHFKGRQSEEGKPDEEKT
ncbi:hypothetical protein BGZ63DRAFT_378848 [Mariannaea sp. PMI_226]|nr:hypothetical protein BGZ63DRAFT_378848 [Mariannaea sp. PMI_226]